MAVSSTRKRLIWLVAALGGALILGMIAVKVWFAATVFAPLDEPLAEVQEPLDATEQVARTMVTPTTPGTPVMPTADFTLNPSDYSIDLASLIPIEVGMDRYAATDELLLYYNASADNASKVSSSERQVDGATLFVIRRSGLEDDSIAAEETYALFEQDLLVAFGSRQQCRRGETPNIWTTELCA